jgi:hypothetical protein
VSGRGPDRGVAEGKPVREIRRGVGDQREEKNKPAREKKQAGEFVYRRMRFPVVPWSRARFLEA